MSSDLILAKEMTQKGSVRREMWPLRARCRESHHVAGGHRGQGANLQGQAASGGDTCLRGQQWTGCVQRTRLNEHRKARTMSARQSQTEETRWGLNPHHMIGETTENHLPLNMKTTWSLENELSELVGWKMAYSVIICCVT